MKYLLLLLVIVVALWWIGGRARRIDQPPRAARRGAPQALEACAHCGVHLPRAEMVAGARGLYCSEAHRLAHGDRG